MVQTGFEKSLIGKLKNEGIFDEFYVEFLLCFEKKMDHVFKNTSLKLKNDENIIFKRGTMPNNRESNKQKDNDEEIPDNVIRIETQDGSGDFIEIIFPEENKDKNKNDK